MSTDDEFPDDFLNVDWDVVGIPALGESLISPLVSAANSPDSSQYSCDDDIDAAFLAEVDALENWATQEGTCFGFRTIGLRM